MNFLSSYDPQTNQGEEPWWSYARDLDVPDIGKLPSYVLGKLPLPGSGIAQAIAGDWQQPEMPRGYSGNYDPNQYVPSTNAERQSRQAGPTPDEEDIRKHEELGPVINAALAATLFAGVPIRAAEAVTNIPIQSYRRKQVAEAIPQLGALFDELGTPLTNVWRGAKGTLEGVYNPAPQFAAAMEEGSTSPATNLLRGIRRKVDDLKGSWNVDIPYVAQGEYPQVLMTKDADNQLLGRIAEALGQAPGRVGEGVRGFYAPVQSQNNYLADIIALRKQFATPEAGTLTHETGHLASKRIRGYGDWGNQPTDAINTARNVAASQDLTDYFHSLVQENRPYKNLLRKRGAYADISPEKLGEEIWTRDNAGQLEKYKGAAPFEDTAPWLSDRLSSLAYDLTHPSLR